MLKLRVVRLREFRREKRLMEQIMKRSTLDMGSVEDDVRNIIEDVKQRGDKAIIEFYKNFFGTDALLKKGIRVSQDEIEEAYEAVSPEVVESLEVAKSNIERFHRKQLPKDAWFMEIADGVIIGQTWRPIESVGIYVPGGRASYPSTALMLGVPARVAGVPKIVACTPPKRDGSVDPAVLVALDIAGVKEINRVGGAHAIAAMAFGTESVSKVLKVVGPGNVWVSTAKKLLRDVIDIEFIAGPSEILIIALDDADPYYVAKDMIAQAEHDPNSAAVAVVLSAEMGNRVREIIEDEVRKAPRKEIVIEALNKYGLIVIADNEDEAIDFANDYAPEHLEILTNKIDEALNIMKGIMNAGSIFIGNYATVPMGDYVTGTNHTLPTGGYAKVRGALSVLDFIKIIDVQIISRNGVKSLGPHAITLAKAEGLENHAGAVSARLTKLP